MALGSDAVLKKTVTIGADPATVWNALTDPGMTERYMFSMRPSTDWRNGSPIIWKGNHDGKEMIHKGRILKIENGKQIVMTDFDMLGSLEDNPANYAKVTYQLSSPAGGQTKLDITEENFQGDKARFEDASRFWDATLQNLKQLLEK